MCSSSALRFRRCGFRFFCSGFYSRLTGCLAIAGPHGVGIGGDLIHVSIGNDTAGLALEDIELGERLGLVVAVLNEEHILAALGSAATQSHQGPTAMQRFPIPPGCQ